MKLNEVAPQYTPGSERKPLGTFNYKTDTDAQTHWGVPEIDRAKEEQRRKESAAHSSRLTDIEFNDEYPNGKHMAPITTKTGIAPNKADAQREINKMSSAAWHVYDSGIEQLPDGRVKFMVKYML